MRRSLTIWRLMVIVMLIAIGCAALFRPSRLAASLVFSSLFLACVLSAIVALFGRRDSRMFWAGFAIAGWAAMLAHFSPMLSQPLARNGAFGSDSLFPSTALLDVVYQHTIEKAYAPVAMSIPAAVVPMPVPPSPAMPAGTLSKPTPGVPPAISITGSLNGVISGGPAPGVTPVLTPGKPATTVTFFMPGPPTDAPRTYWLDVDYGQATPIPARSASFLTIGYSILSLAFACLCGWFVAWLQSRPTREVVDANA